MRLVTRSFSKEFVASVGSLLKSEGIQHSIDAVNQEFFVWVLDEDDFPRAEALMKATIKPESMLDRYILQHFQLSAFKRIPKNFPTITYVIICLCTLLLFFDKWTTKSVPVAFGSTIVMSSPIQEALLFDTSLRNNLLGDFIIKHMHDDTFSESSLSTNELETYHSISLLPSWDGFYPYFVSKLQQEDYILDFSDLFRLERKGEFWRLFTPALLHINIFHLLFNMLWALLLGKELEPKLGKKKFILLILLIALFSNLSQYMMSGPYFMGFSGVIAGLVGFLAARKRFFPWELYDINDSSISFVFFFISILAGASLIVFFLEGFFHIEFPVLFANSAHVVGFLTGALLGTFRNFSPSKKLEVKKDP